MCRKRPTDLISLCFAIHLRPRLLGGLSWESPIEVGFERRLVDEEAVKAMLRAVVNVQDDLGELAMTIVYTAVTRFDPDHGDTWRKFIEWSGLTQLREVISLDGLLCPTAIQELTEEDWKYNVHVDYRTHLFRDLDYLLHRVSENKRINVLAVMQDPTATDLRSFVDPHFVFRGCDLIETQGSISALVNCGGFDRAYAKADLSEYGLLADPAKALTVQQLLRSEYPDEHHAECDVWAIWQRIL